MASFINEISLHPVTPHYKMLQHIRSSPSFLKLLPLTFQPPLLVRRLYSFLPITLPPSLLFLLSSMLIFQPTSPVSPHLNKCSSTPTVVPLIVATKAIVVNTIGPITTLITTIIPAVPLLIIISPDRVALVLGPVLPCPD